MIQIKFLEMQKQKFCKKNVNLLSKQEKNINFNHIPFSYQDRITEKAHEMRGESNTNKYYQNILNAQK